MKKIILSAAVAAMAFSTSAMAADKGIDIDVGGQAVVYYQTSDADGQDGSFFDKDNSIANVGIQLDLGADLGNDFTFGSQLTYLGTAGLEKNLVNGVPQTSDNNSIDRGDDTTGEIALTKIFIAKKIANTTVKIGRQELPKSLSPLAFSEGWNVFKNTFDAILVVNTDIPKTTLVGAYVGSGTGSNELENIGNLETSVGEVTGDTYMITAQTKAIPMTTLTASYYRLNHVSVDTTAYAADNDDLSGNGGVSTDAYWIDAQVKPMDMLTIAAQYGNMDPDVFDDTTAYGVKVAVKPVDGLSLCLVYNDVDDGAVAMKNTTNVKTPLYSQMIANQNAIALDAETIMGKVAYNTGSFGTFSLTYADTDAGNSNLTTYVNGAGKTVGDDYTELDVVYKIKAGGVQYFAAYVAQDWDDKADNEIIRVWARYAF